MPPHKKCCKPGQNAKYPSDDGDNAARLAHVILPCWFETGDKVARRHDGSCRFQFGLSRKANTTGSVASLAHT